MSAARIERPGADSAARETVLSSSRMLPGQWYEASSSCDFGRELFRVERQSVRGAVAREKAIRQHRNIHGALAQRRQPDREGVDAVVEIFAETALAHEHVERAIGGRDQAEVDVDRFVAAEAFEASLFEHAQQLGLRHQRHVADFVEEQRAAVGELEAARLAIVRAGEGAFFIAENFRFEQAVRERGAVDGLEVLRARAATARESCARRLPCRLRSDRGSAPRCPTSPRSESTRRSRASSRRARSFRGSAAPTATIPRCRGWRALRGRFRGALRSAPARASIAP